MECRAIDTKMSVKEMGMLKWISEVIREGKIRNGFIKTSIGVVFIVNTIIGGDSSSKTEKEMVKHN